MHESEYDVIVVGGGPAGATTARYAAQAGLRVLVVDKKSELGTPVQCSGAVSANALHECEVPFDDEFISNFSTRVFTALKDIGEHNEGSVLLVSHGVWTMVALGKWFEPDLTQWPTFRVDNCSISAVLFEPAPRLIKFNETQHLFVGV